MLSAGLGLLLGLQACQAPQDQNETASGDADVTHVDGRDTAQEVGGLRLQVSGILPAITDSDGTTGPIRYRLRANFKLQGARNGRDLRYLSTDTPQTRELSLKTGDDGTPPFQTALQLSAVPAGEHDLTLLGHYLEDDETFAASDDEEDACWVIEEWSEDGWTAVPKKDVKLVSPRTQRCQIERDKTAPAGWRFEICDREVRFEKGQLDVQVQFIGSPWPRYRKAAAGATVYAVSASGELHAWANSHDAALESLSLEQQRSHVYNAAEDGFALFGGPVSEVSQNGDEVCVLVAGAVKCFDPQAGAAPEVRTMVDSQAIALATAENFSCALLGRGTDARLDDGVYCWNDGEVVDESCPRRLEQLSEVYSLSAQGSTVCATTGEGRALCWGADLQPRQLGTLNDGVFGEYDFDHNEYPLFAMRALAGRGERALHCVLTDAQEVYCGRDASALTKVSWASEVYDMAVGEGILCTMQLQPDATLDVVCAEPDHSCGCWVFESGDGPLVPGEDHVQEALNLDMAVVSDEGGQTVERLCVVRQDGAVLCSDRHFRAHAP